MKTWLNLTSNSLDLDKIAQNLMCKNEVILKLFKKTPVVYFRFKTLGNKYTSLCSFFKQYENHFSEISFEKIALTGISVRVCTYLPPIIGNKEVASYIGVVITLSRSLLYSSSEIHLILHISKIQLVVDYYQCYVLIGWVTTRLYVIAH